MNANPEMDPTVVAFDQAQAQVDANADLKALETARAELQYFTEQVLRVRADRDFWQQRWKFQQVANEGALELHRLHKEQVDRLSPRINELECLLGLIPGCHGDFDKAKAKLIEIFGCGGAHPTAEDGRSGRDGLGGQDISARPLGNESHCVCHVTTNAASNGKLISILRCGTCNEIVGEETHSSQEPSPSVHSTMVHRKLGKLWAAHVRSKSPTDNLPRNAAQGAGARDLTHPDGSAPALNSNPNAEVKPAFPGGRW